VSDDDTLETMSLNELMELDPVQMLADHQDVSYEEARQVPPALAKAMHDPFSYALRLRTGEEFEFESAELETPGWVHLREVRGIHPFPHGPVERGIDVRISEIVWVLDAPGGS
jgi:hypothetical protein